MGNLIKRIDKGQGMYHAIKAVALAAQDIKTSATLRLLFPPIVHLSHSLSTISANYPRSVKVCTNSRQQLRDASPPCLLACSSFKETYSPPK